jgi:hypothetical protein
MQKGLVTQAEEERRRGRYGYLSDLIPSFGGSDAPYFADMILSSMQHTSLTDEKRNKAATHIRATALVFTYLLIASS